MFCVTAICVLISTLHGHVGLNVSAYARLRNDLLSRDAVIHQVSPRRVDPKQNFTITLNFVGYDILDIDQIKQVRISRITLYIFSPCPLLYLYTLPGRLRTLSRKKNSASSQK